MAIMEASSYNFCLTFASISQRGSDDEVVTAELFASKAGPSMMGREEKLHPCGRCVMSHSCGAHCPGGRKSLHMPHTV